MNEKYIVVNDSKTVEVAIKHAVKIYSRLSTVTLICGVYILVNEIRSRKQNEKIKELKRTIEELKTEKGA